MRITAETTSTAMPLPHSTPQDRANRDRIEHVTSQLLRLCGELEQRIGHLETRMAEYEREQEQTRG